MKTLLKVTSAIPRAFHASSIGLILTLCGCAHTALRQQSAELDITSALDLPPGVIAPAPVRTVAPEHLNWPLRAGLEGEAWLKCLIDENGMVRDVSVVNASYVDFGDAAMEAVRKWSFAPGTRDGRPIAMRVLIPFHFRLSEGERAVYR